MQRRLSCVSDLCLWAHKERFDDALGVSAVVVEDYNNNPTRLYTVHYTSDRENDSTIYYSTPGIVFYTVGKWAGNLML